MPCSLCDATFENPRELGTHILAAHCGAEDSNGGGTATAKKAKRKRKARPTLTTTLAPNIVASANPPPPLLPPLPAPPPMVRAMMVPAPPTWVALPNAESTPVPAAVMAIMAPVVNAPDPSGVAESGSGSAAKRPKNTSDEERNEKFMTIRLSEFSCKYVCLVCNKAYTSRYNIRMHCNMHTGKNVHRCK